MENLKLENTSGVIKAAMASDFHLSKESFYKYVKANGYERVGPGMYISPNEFVDELLVLHKRCPGGVISHDEALYHHGLIDREPMAHTITVYSGYNATRLRKSGYQVYYVSKDLLELGKLMVTDQFGNEIPMYDLERTIVDMVRNRGEFEIQDFNTALKTYVAMPARNLARLSEYAKAFRVEKILRGYLEVLI